MNNEHNDKQPLNLDELEQVSGGASGIEIQDFINNRIKPDGHYQELVDILRTYGRQAVANKCIEYYPELKNDSMAFGIATLMMMMLM